ncbi:hypothetical protein [Tepidiforma sp.]|uniref:hypothetical protein n=1 Tax=Tepidiforma sp. TaxID=2682230 RepID=UPI002ADD5FA8|nr:hypothetical protein [Tepidiforma sp.]
MKGLALAALVVTAAVAQVTVAPLFPVRGAVPELVVLTLAMIGTFAGPRAAMVLTPAAALAAGFLSDRDAGLLLVAYLPLLPLGAWLEDAPLPLAAGVRSWLTVLGAGVAYRVVLAAAAMLTGARVMVGPLVWDVVFPGLLVDSLFFSLCYIPLRLVGWSGGGLKLSRGRYVSGL